MNADQRVQILQNIAEAIARRRLIAPARLALDAIAPLGFLASQVAVFVGPLVPLGRWHEYVAALDDERSWKELQNLIDYQDC